MTQQIINVGNVANDGLGDPLRTAFIKTNDNFTELYNSVAGGTGIQNGNSNVKVYANGNVTTSVNGTANVLVVQSTGALITGVNSVSGNVTGGNILTAGLISATGAIQVGGDMSLVGNIVDTGPLTITTSSSGNITLSPNGTGNINTTANIMPSANATANIGSTSFRYNTIFGLSTSAQYADLAEKYTADADYAPGTVLEFGGDQEVTATTTSHSPRVAGIVSTMPSYRMNDGLVSDHTAMVSLTGRVPCLVQGPIAKGDRLVASAVVGHARRLDPAQYEPGCIIGKALEDYPSPAIGTIEVAVGRF